MASVDSHRRDREEEQGTPARASRSPRGRGEGADGREGLRLRPAQRTVGPSVLRGPQSEWVATADATSKGLKHPGSRL